MFPLLFLLSFSHFRYFQFHIFLKLSMVPIFSILPISLIFSKFIFFIFCILPVFLIFPNYISLQFSCYFPISYFPKFQFSWHFPILFFQVSILSIFSIPTLSHIVSLLSSHSILHSTSIYNFPKFHLISTSHYNFPKFSDQVLFHSNFVPSTSPLNSTLSSHCPRSSIFFPLSTLLQCPVRGLVPFLSNSSSSI